LAFSLGENKILFLPTGGNALTSDQLLGSCLRDFHLGAQLAKVTPTCARRIAAVV
jgi:hypothetical protein